MIDEIFVKAKSFVVTGVTAFVNNEAVAFIRDSLKDFAGGDVVGGIAAGKEILEKVNVLSEDGGRRENGKEKIE